MGASRIPQPQVDKLGLNSISLRFPRVEDTTGPGESVLPSLSGRFNRPAFDSLASHLGTTAARFVSYFILPFIRHENDSLDFWNGRGVLKYKDSQCLIFLHMQISGTRLHDV